MKRHIPGLHSRQQDGDRPLEGLFLVRVEWASYRWHPQKAFLQVRFVVLEPEVFRTPILLRPALLRPNAPSGSSIGSCAISAMTWNCSARIRWMKRPWSTFAVSSEPPT